MESTILGVVLDSSVLIGAERAKLNAPEIIRAIWSLTGDLPIVMSALTVAELGHGSIGHKIHSAANRDGVFWMSLSLKSQFIP